jgi:hypothetical protein
MQAREEVPLPTDFERELGISATLAGVIVTLYSEQSWVYLSQAFDEAFSGDGTTFMWLADFYNDRDPNGGYLTNINEANYAINCADDSQFSVSDEKNEEIMAPCLVSTSAIPLIAAQAGQRELVCRSWIMPKSSKLDLWLSELPETQPRLMSRQ